MNYQNYQNFNLLRYETNTDASILVYKFRPEKTGFNTQSIRNGNMYAEYSLHYNLGQLSFTEQAQLSGIYSVKENRNDVT